MSTQRTYGSFHEIAPEVWELSSSLRSDMRVPARVFLEQQLLESIIADESAQQLANVATLPGIQDYALAMPDIHQGYGFPVGGVAAIRTTDGVISPGGIGYDINCGVRLILSDDEESSVRPYLDKLATTLQQFIPSGVGVGGEWKLAAKELNGVLTCGVGWAKAQGLASENDIECTEERGCYQVADAECVSTSAKERGANQLGTMGSGNHFVEVQRVAQIYDQKHARTFGLWSGQVVVMVHTGSRGLGHQVCTDYVRLMNQTMFKYGITLPDRELACAPFVSDEGQRYFRAMAAAANFAWTNRQIITYQIRQAWEQVLGTGSARFLRLLYDVSHNIAKVETYSGHECVVHRKGATRSFGPGHRALPAQFRAAGQPVIIPGSMGTASYVLVGTEAAMQHSFGSCCHGAGRALSRTKARKLVEYQTLIDDLSAKKIEVRSASAKGLLEEAPEAYKDIERVVGVVERVGISRRVARLEPVAVIKG